MIRKPFVLRDYSRKNPLEQVQFGTNVIAGITDHPVAFPPVELPVTLADLTTVTTELSTRYNDYKTKGNSHKEAFLAAQLIWVERFNVIADYVDMKAHAAGVVDAGTIIQLSGFGITKTETSPAELPVQPIAEMEISNSDRGAMWASAQPVSGAKGYFFSLVSENVQIEITGNQITIKMGDSFASFIVGTRREVKFQNLPATEVTAAVAAFNTAGLGQFSDVTEVKIP